MVFLLLSLRLRSRPSSPPKLTPNWPVSLLCGSSRNTPHHNTCLELLIAGHVNAFIELFELTSKGAWKN